jgi:hypothetical protein
MKLTTSLTLMDYVSEAAFSLKDRIIFVIFFKEFNEACSYQRS